MLRVSIAVFGLACFAVAVTFESFGDGPVGPQFVPSATTGSVVVLGITLCLSDLRARRRRAPRRAIR